MTEQECLDRMVAPGTRRPGKYREGVIQILVTSSCDKACFGCTQASNLQRPKWEMTPEHFEQAVRSLGFRELGKPDPQGYQSQVGGPGVYFGVVGLFGGNPALSRHFEAYCGILHKLVPYNQRGIWCNNPISVEKARMMRATFDPSVSNLNVHLDVDAARMFRQGWPESRIVGEHDDCRHSPPWVAMKDVVKKDCKCVNWGPTLVPHRECGGTGKVPDTERIHELISNCDINQHWSAMIGVFRGQLRAWFCEVAGAQAILHQFDTDQRDPMPACTCGADRTGPSAEAHDDSCPAKVRYTYPDTGLNPLVGHKDAGYKIPALAWWELRMDAFAHQVRKHCFDCGVPLRGYGELAQGDRPGYIHPQDYEAGQDPKEQTSATHAAVYKSKRQGRRVEVVTDLVQLGMGRIGMVTRYMQNARA